MALIRCPQCGKLFSEHASACPQCGLAKEDAISLIEQEEQRRKVVVAKVLIGIGIICACFTAYLCIWGYKHHESVSRSVLNATSSTNTVESSMPNVAETAEVDEAIDDISSGEPQFSVIYDLKWARVQGSVKTIMQYTPENGNNYEERVSYQFDKNGVLVSVNNRKMKIMRDSAGMIERICSMADTEMDIGTSYICDANGFVVEEHIPGYGWADNFEYQNNKKGWCVSAKAEAGGDCDETPRKYSYSYSDIDAHGNWLKQHTKVIWQEKEPRTETFVTTRTITYWDE